MKTTIYVFSSFVRFSGEIRFNILLINCGFLLAAQKCTHFSRKLQLSILYCKTLLRICFVIIMVVSAYIRCYNCSLTDSFTGTEEKLTQLNGRHM